MSFATLNFVGFFAIAFGGVVLLRQRNVWYKLWLMIMSLAFYRLWSTTFLLLLLASVFVNYYFVLEASPSSLKLRRTNSRKLFLVIGIVANLVQLGIFKYFNFFIDSLYSLLHVFHLSVDINLLALLAPVGLSFYTFRTIAHLVDSYHGKIVLPSFLDYANYITFFPHIASGPIARPQPFYDDLNGRSGFVYNEARVIVLIISGLMKKLVLSSFLYNFIQGPFATPQNYSSLDLWIAVLAYACYLYVDFSGYSDLAIAISNLLGINTAANFDRPYASLNLSEFWKRWHISLSSWFRDYVYIPLGGSRGPKVTAKHLDGSVTDTYAPIKPARRYFNVIATMTLSGLWHGAGWPFILWGFGLGVASAINHRLSLWLKFWQDNVVRRTLSWVGTFTTVSLLWVFFNSPTLDSALMYYGGLTTAKIHTVTLVQPVLLIVLGLIVLFNLIGHRVGFWLEAILNVSSFRAKVVVVVVCLAVIVGLKPDLVPPFVYFSF